jgi:hypothetical protein
MYQKPKLQSYTLPSYETTHIMRAPPSSKYTRKHEPVDVSNTLWMIRNDDSRINEGISYIPRGSNPMVDVSYSNYGGNGAVPTTMPVISAKNPYKVLKDGAFRPPVFTMEDLLPLSRMKYDNTSAITNPGVPGGFVSPELMDNVDKDPIKHAVAKRKINAFNVAPNASYWIELPKEVSSTVPLMRESINIPVSSSLYIQGLEGCDGIQTLPPLGTIHEDKQNILNVSSNVSIVVYDSSSQQYQEIQGSTKDKMNLAVSASLNKPIDLTREDGTPIKVKEYRWKVVQSAVGGNDLVVIETQNPDLQLERNTPLYSMGSNVNGYTKALQLNTENIMTKDSTTISASTPITSSTGRNEAIRDQDYDIKLRRQGAFGEFSNAGSMSNVYQGMVDNTPLLRRKQIDIQPSVDRYQRFA